MVRAESGAERLKVKALAKNRCIFLPRIWRLLEDEFLKTCSSRSSDAALSSAAASDGVVTIVSACVPARPSATKKTNNVDKIDCFTGVWPNNSKTLSQ